MTGGKYDSRGRKEFCDVYRRKLVFDVDILFLCKPSRGDNPRYPIGGQDTFCDFQVFMCSFPCTGRDVATHLNSIFEKIKIIHFVLAKNEYTKHIVLYCAQKSIVGIKSLIVHFLNCIYIPLHFCLQTRRAIFQNEHVFKSVHPPIMLPNYEVNTS